jgi:hypothetical protein
MLVFQTLFSHITTKPQLDIQYVTFQVTIFISSLFI